MKTGQAERVAVLALAFACGGLAAGCGRSSVLDETSADAGGSGSGGSSGGSSASSSGAGSSSGSGPIVDASMPDAGCDARRLEAQVCQALGSGGAGAHPFDRHVDFVNFFRQSALSSDPALCGGGTTVSTCAYDPTIPRSGPADIHHSNALGEFVGPDGDAWIWDYVQPRNWWIAVDENGSPANYALVIDYESCFLEQDAGPGTVLDASTESLCPQGTASCGAVESCLDALAEPPPPPPCGGPDWVFFFEREADLIAYMQMVLQTDAAPVEPPTVPAQFVGADGHPYVYGWLQNDNEWFVVDGYHAPAAYQLGVEYDQCTAPDAAAD